jgi:hypothetical protein
MKFSQTPEPMRKERIDYIDHRWKQLYDLTTDSAKSALHYLFLVNAGGAATTLAFIGAVGADKIGLGAKLSLSFFVTGLILFGVSKAMTFHHMDGLFKHWKSLVNDYFSDKIPYEEILQRDNKKAVDGIWDYVFPYASFACFIIGSFTGFCALI